MAGLSGRGWIWAALVILIAMIVFMWVRASTFYGDVRRAAGQGRYDMRAFKEMPAAAANPTEFGVMKPF